MEEKKQIQKLQKMEDKPDPKMSETDKEYSKVIYKDAY